MEHRYWNIRNGTSMMEQPILAKEITFEVSNFPRRISYSCHTITMTKDFSLSVANTHLKSQILKI